MITNKYNPIDNNEIERAVKFMVASFAKHKKAGKPVVVHSLRVAFYLDFLGYPKEIVIAALLHDILEDSEVTLEELKKRFGGKVAKVVEVNSLDLSLPKNAGRYKKAYSLAKENGLDALLIRGADLLDNSKYYYLVKSKDLKKLLLWKYDYFLKISEELIGNTQVFKDFKTYRQNLV